MLLVTLASPCAAVFRVLAQKCAATKGNIIAMVEMELTPEDAVDPRLFIAPQNRTFGGTADSELLHKKIRVRMGERPTARNVRKMFEAEGKELPADLKVYAAYDIWLVGMSVGVLKEGGWQSVKRLGLQVELPSSPRFVVIGMAPETRLIVRGNAGLECRLELGANGGLAVPDAVSAAVKAALPVTAEASASAKVSAKSGVNVSFSVISPAIIAVGKGDRRVEWVIEDADGPLLGDQELCFTVLTPIVADEIEMTARISATISTFDLLPCLLRGPEVPVKAVLQ